MQLSCAQKQNATSNKVKLEIFLSDRHSDNYDANKKSPAKNFIGMRLTSNTDQVLQVKRPQQIFFDRDTLEYRDAVFEVWSTGGTPSCILPESDCDASPSDEPIYQPLTKGESVTYEFWLPCLYSLIPGKSYKVRAVYQFSNNTNLSIKKVYSNWLEFIF
jgi:hypothetical protein